MRRIRLNHRRVWKPHRKKREKNINGARRKWRLQFPRAAKREVTAMKKPKQTVQTPFQISYPPPLEQQPVPCRHCCECSRCYFRGASSSFGATATTGCRFSRSLQLRQLPLLLEIQTFCKLNKCKRQQLQTQPWCLKPPLVKRNLFLASEALDKVQAEPSFWETISSGSPHAHELRRATSVGHFGQSPPTSQMQNLSMQRQHAVAAKAAAAVQLPVVYASPLGPGRGTLGRRGFRGRNEHRVGGGSSGDRGTKRLERRK